MKKDSPNRRNGSSPFKVVGGWKKKGKELNSDGRKQGVPKKTFIYRHKGALLRTSSDWDSSTISNTIPQKRVPYRFWSEERNQREWLDQIGGQLGVKVMEDWYKLSSREVCAKTSFIYSHYKGSLIEALKKIYPEYTWDPTAFCTVSRGHWLAQNNCRNALDSLASKIGVVNSEDWYDFSISSTTNEQREEIRKEWRVIKRHNSSLYAALKAIYPEVKWKPWRFKHPPLKLWSEFTNITECLDEIANRLEILTPSQWIGVPLQWISSCKGGRSLLRHFNNRKKRLLQVVHPTIDWTLVTRYSTMSSLEKSAWSALEVLFKEEVLYQYEFAFSHLDFFIPKYRLAFEVQGEQHLNNAHFRGDCKAQQYRDHLKQLLCAQHNITLIPIGSWWNRTPHSLRATITNIRPDIQLDQCQQSNQPLCISMATVTL